jgi:hypothetical protein
VIFKRGLTSVRPETARPCRNVRAGYSDRLRQTGGENGTRKESRLAIEEGKVEEVTRRG